MLHLLVWVTSTILCLSVFPSQGQTCEQSRCSAVCRALRCQVLEKARCACRQRQQAAEALFPLRGGPSELRGAVPGQGQPGGHHGHAALALFLQAGRRGERAVLIPLLCGSCCCCCCTCHCHNWCVLRAKQCEHTGFSFHLVDSKTTSKLRHPQIRTIPADRS